MDSEFSFTTTEAEPIELERPEEFSVLTPMKRERPPEPEDILPSERVYAEANPNLYAFDRAVIRPLIDVMGPLDKLYPWGREEFMKLDKQHQVRSILWDTVDTLVLGFGSLAWRAMKAGVGIKAAKQFTRGAGTVSWSGAPKTGRPVSSMRPVEDLVMESVPEFSHSVELNKLLKHKGFTKLEREVILERAPNLKNTNLVDPRIAWEKPSKAMLKNTDWIGGGVYLKDDFLGMASREALRWGQVRKAQESALRTYFGRSYDPQHVDGILRGEAEQIIGYRWASKINPEAYSVPLMENILANISAGPRGLHRFTDMAFGSMWPASATPTRVIFGRWNLPFRTYDNIYKPGIQILRNTSNYNGAKVHVWHGMLEKAGLAKGPTIAGKVPKMSFTPAQSDEATRLLNLRDDLTQAVAMKKIDPGTASDRIKNAFRFVEPTVAKIINTHDSFMRHLYADELKLKLPLVFERAGLTEMGQRHMEEFVIKASRRVNMLFARLSPYDHKSRVLGMEKILEGARRLAKYEPNHPWFTAEGPELKGVLAKLEWELTSGSKGGWASYLENYTARVGASHRKASMGAMRALMGETKAFYTMERAVAIPFKRATDLGSIIEGRVSSQAKELFMNRQMGDIVRFARKLPDPIKHYTDYFLGRMTNRPAAMDVWLAGQLQKWTNMIATGASKDLIRWDARRVLALAQTINDMTHMGGLGFKPFSVIRNWFQPLLNNTANMGGVKDFKYLVRGAGTIAANAKKEPFSGLTYRAYIESIGAIQEYVPEMVLRSRALPWSRTKILGKALPHTDRTRDAALWAFRGSHNWNCYTSGAGALEKWADALVSLKGYKALKTDRAVTEFMRRSGVRSQYPWVINEVEDLLRAGKFAEAKAVHVYNVIADVQYLYTPLDMPILAQKYGAVGRTGAIFQSWWMNYGTLWSKWLSSGGVDAPPKAARIFTAMLSTAIAEQGMEFMWGRRTAMKSVGLGVFPTEFNEFLIPPAWTPIYFGTKAVVNAGQVLLGKDPKIAMRSAKQMLRSFIIFGPGGLQMGMIARGAKKGGLPGAFKAVLRLQRDEGYRPLFGMLPTQKQLKKFMIGREG